MAIIAALALLPVFFWIANVLERIAAALERMNEMAAAGDPLNPPEREP